MENLDLKIKLAVLWIFLAVGMSAMVLLALMTPGAIEQIIAGEIEGMKITEGLMLFLAIFWLIPLTMAFLSLILKDSINRWANIIAGIAWAAFGILDVGDTLMRGLWTSFVLSAVKLVVAVLIIWLAWMWPKQKAATKPKK